MTQASESSDATAEIEIELLLGAIYAKYHYDFRGYATASLKRRLAHAQEALDCKTLSRLQERVLHEPNVFQEVLRYLTVQVSEMFRDPDYYKALRDTVVPVLRTYPSLKLWVAGCSTGEEVYSLAILLHEEGLLERTMIYATDISLESLKAAEAGVYAIDRIAQFSENYARSGARSSLSDYYTAAYGAAVFDRALVRNAIFSDHSLATDSVFAEVQLISCRNVLIYFDRALQDRTIGLFRDSLCRKGFLGLGSNETLQFCAHAGAFSDFAPAERIYQRKE